MKTEFSEQYLSLNHNDLHFNNNFKVTFLWKKMYMKIKFRSFVLLIYQPVVVCKHTEGRAQKNLWKWSWRQFKLRLIISNQKTLQLNLSSVWIHSSCTLFLLFIFESLILKCHHVCTACLYQIWVKISFLRNCRLLFALTIIIKNTHQKWPNYFSLNIVFLYT